MKTLVLVLLAFVAATLAAENEVNFLFAGMIPPATSTSGSGFTATTLTLLEVTNKHSASLANPSLITDSACNFALRHWLRQQLWRRH